MSPPHGTKRPSDCALDGEQRLSKRFDLLNLDNARKAARLYMPVPRESSTTSMTPTPMSTPTSTSTSTYMSTPTPTSTSTPTVDAMLVEDTPHRVYIHDLAAELSDVESDDDHPVFLSDIERHLAKIPRHVLLGPPPKPTQHNQVVLYNVPASLTLPEEHDNVRKAIVEARQRIRDRQLSPVTEPERITAHVGAPGVEVEDHDADAMDLD